MTKRWIKAYILHMEDSPCGHEIISPMGKQDEAFCPVCMERLKSERGVA